MIQVDDVKQIRSTLRLINDYYIVRYIQIPDYLNPQLSGVGLDLMRMHTRNSMCQLWRKIALRVATPRDEKEGFYVKTMKIGDYKSLNRKLSA